MTRQKSLSSLRPCFQGLMPAFIATCSADGTPNVTYLSQVYFIDERHVALSCQFFNKTRRNIAENPLASVSVNDPTTLEAYELSLRYHHSETSGPLFDEMETRISAIASQTGMTGVFRLIAADVYEVEGVAAVDGFLTAAPGEPGMAEQAPPSLRGELHALSQVTERLRSPRDLEGLFSALLDALRGALGFEHIMVLVPDEREERLFTVASHGYGDAGIGAEVAFGEGLIGTAARRRRTLRLADVDADLRYGRAVRRSVMMAGGGDPLDPEIPLPGLSDAQSHIAIPLVSGERLFGVLAVESRRTRGFDEWHAAFLDIVGCVAATAIENLTLRADAEGAERPGPKRPAAPSASALTTGRGRKAVRTFCMYRNDDCVFVDGKYLIRNVPARILWKILKSYREEGRAEFSNRELRLDPQLGLPPVKDNLESRLILLRRRLEQKCPDVRMVPTCRGEFSLEIDPTIELVEKESA